MQGTFPLPIRSRRGERDFSPDVKEKNLSYSLRTADTFHSFSPKKKSHRAGNARRPAASRGIKNIVTKATP